MITMWEKAKKTLVSDKYIGPLITKFGDCRLTPSPQKLYFVDLVEAICSQQLSGKAASTIFGRIKAGLGRVVPDKILMTKDKDFRSWGLSRQKIKYLRDLSVKVKNKELEINKLDKLSDEEVKRELINIKGIGNWTAEMFLMFSLGRVDVFPADDLGIKNGTKKLVGRAISDRKLDQFAIRWKPYRTYAAWYIWKSLDNR